MSIQEAIGSIPDFGGVPTLQGLEFEPSGKPGVLQMKSSGRQSVKFYWADTYNEFKTLQKRDEARQSGSLAPVAPVYEKREMVRIVTPGDRSIYDGLAEDYHKRNYFQQYAKFRDGKDVDIGARLEQAEFIQAPEIIELNYLGVYSIQQMAEAADTLCERLPRGYELREGCRAWVQMRQGNALEGITKRVSAELSSAQSLIVALQKESDERKRELETVKAMLSNLSITAQAEVAKAEAPSKKKAGRTKKVAMPEEVKEETAQ
jgi:hypothetical protein